MGDDREPTQARVLWGRFARVPWRRAIGASLRARRQAGSLLLPERLEGAIYGHLVGDALGVPYEFSPPGSIDEIGWRGDGHHGQPPGTWSDDGALMLALLDSLLSVGFDTEDQARRALAWRDEGRYAPGARVFDIGGATRTALDRIGAGTAAAEAGAAHAKGNGSLMRILPLALVMRDATPTELVDMAARASRVTHGSAEAQIACALHALVVRGLLAGRRDRDEVLDAATRDLRAILGARGMPGSPEASDPDAALAALQAFLAWGGRGGTGRVVDSFWSAWDCFAGAGSYREAVTSAVALGADTDTTAAIAGGLAGAWWGIDAIPPEWRRGLREQAIPRVLTDRLVQTDDAGWDGHPWRTSTSSPMRLERLDLTSAVDRSGGSVGITFLPGRRYIGYHTGAQWRSLDADVAALREQGVDVMLLLVEDRELRRCRVLDIGAVLADHEVDLVRFPIRDPLTPVDGLAFRSAVVGLLERVRDGESLAITCRGGLDRSGLAAACLLREAGLPADEAIERVQAARLGALTLPEQQAYVRRWPPSG
jgi:ADP-ribosyl-[dinitrogen reductase] hydrolase